MTTNWIPLQSIPREGKLLKYDDPSIWEAPLAEHGIACRIVEPMRAEVRVLPQEEGILFQGRMAGTVSLPCNRCAESSLVVVDHAFDNFESLPARESGGKDADEGDASVMDTDDAVIRLVAHGTGVEINPAALVWEEFSLALPVNPLCNQGCRGLCHKCGANLNHESCACNPDEGDPRMAALRGLQVKDK